MKVLVEPTIVLTTPIKNLEAFMIETEFCFNTFSNLDWNEGPTSGALQWKQFVFVNSSDFKM